jgi:hypothetical protein
MKRTQIQLEDGTYRLLKKRAFEQGKSVSAIVREMVEEGLRTPKRRLRMEDLTFIGAGKSEPSPLDPISENIDAALAEDFLRPSR